MDCPHCSPQAEKMSFSCFTSPQANSALQCSFPAAQSGHPTLCKLYKVLDNPILMPQLSEFQSTPQAFHCLAVSGGSPRSAGKHSSKTFLVCTLSSIRRFNSSLKSPVSKYKSLSNPLSSQLPSTVSTSGDWENVNQPRTISSHNKQFLEATLQRAWSSEPAK